MNKIDILLAIDNSGSMGDKQRFLAEARTLAQLQHPAVVKALVWIVAAACGSTVAFQAMGL